MWARSDRAYVASPDSLAAAEGDSLAFVAHGRTVAVGIVTQVLEGNFAFVRLTSGSLAGVKRLEQLGIRAWRGVLRSLRVGMPGLSRPNLLFGCTGLSFGDLSDQQSFDREKLGDGVYRFVARRPYSSRVTPLKSDTVLVRLFDDSTDEEIALERGDVDVAVFWPGELSSHIRGPRWGGSIEPLVPPRTRLRLSRVMAAFLPDPTAPDAPVQQAEVQQAMRSLARETFRGEVYELPLPPYGRDTTRAAALAAPVVAMRFEVDRACPGWEVMERFLNRGTNAQAPATGPRVRVTYLGGSPTLTAAAVRYIRPTDSRAAVLARADTLDATAWRLARQMTHSTEAGAWFTVLRDSLGLVSVFDFRCPVVSKRELDPYVRTIAPALVNMLDCGPASRDR